MTLALNGQLREVQKRQNDMSVDLGELIRKIDSEQ